MLELSSKNKSPACGCYRDTLTCENRFATESLNTRSHLSNKYKKETHYQKGVHQ
jgi:hypothetical protein